MPRRLVEEEGQDVITLGLEWIASLSCRSKIPTFGACRYAGKVIAHKAKACGLRLSCFQLPLMIFLTDVPINLSGMSVIHGPGSSVGIATDYLLDGPGIESRWRRDFPHLSRPTLGPNQPPVQRVPGLSWGKERPERDADPLPPSSAVVKKG